MYSLKCKLITSLFICLFFAHSAYAQKKEVLLIGTFHFANPGLDATKLKSLDIESAPVQTEINRIVTAIKTFHPDKILVEYAYQDQSKLNLMYADFLTDKTVTGINKKSEIYQIAFKAAKELELSQINAIDYKLNLTGTDSVMKVMQSEKQEELMRAIPNHIQTMAGNFNKMAQSGTSLTDMILSLNTEAYRASDLGFYTSLLTKAGSKDNFIGADVATQWYKRNIYMFSLIQKIITAKDKKVLILLGASHIAALQNFIKLNPEYNIVELKDILKK